MVVRALWIPLAIAACSSTQASEKERAQGPPPMPVEIQSVKASPIVDTTEYVALLKSRRSVQIQPLVEGHVTRILVSPGDRIEPGRPLLVIDPSRQRAVVNSQKATEQANAANLDYWRKQVARLRTLLRGGAATRQDMDQAQNALRQAEAAVAASQAQARASTVELKYFTVVAPAAGNVGDIPVRIGDLVGTQTLLTTLDDNDVLEIYLNVPSERAVGLDVGTAIEIVDGAGKPLATSTVGFISPRADPATQTVLVKADIDNRAGHLRSNQFVRARVVWSRRVGPTVPVLSVQSRAGQTFVWVARPPQAGTAGTSARGGQGAPGGAWSVEQRPVQVGPIQGQSYPVVSGLAVGESVVVAGVQKLRPGAPVVPAAGRQ